MPIPGGRRWVEWAILTAYIALSLAMSYPLPAHLATDVAGRQTDARVFQWNHWWLKDALLHGRSLTHTDYLYYPTGVSLAGHNINWVSSFLSVPLDLLFGPLGSYNLTFLLTLFGSAYAMYWLVCYLVRRRDAAFVAGLIFGFAPYHLSGNWDGQMNLANVQWLPLFALFLLRTLDHKRVRDALWAGVFLALSGLDCWFFLPFLGIWGSLFLAYSLIWERAKWNLRAAWLLALAGAVAALLAMPFLWPVVAAPGGGAVGDALNYYAETKSTDLLAFVTPSSDHPLLSRYVEEVYERFSHWRPAFLGYAALALACYGAVARRHMAIPWAASGLLFASLALGTVLRVNGVEHPGVPMPFDLLTRWVPAFRLIRQASRFNVMVAFSLAVLAGLGCAELFRRLSRWAGHDGRPQLREKGTGRRAWVGYAVPALLSAWILFEYLAIPCPLLPGAISPFYWTLAQEPGDFAILELPLGLLPARRSLYPQIYHHKKLVNGYVARASFDADAFMFGNPLLKALYFQIDPDPALHDLPSEIGLLALNDIRYVVIQKLPMPLFPAVEPGVLAAWRHVFGPEPLYEDDEIVVYRTRPMPGQGAEPLLHFAGQLGLTAVEAQRTQALDRQALTVDLTWKALEDLSHTYDCALTLEGDAGHLARVQDRILPHYPTDRWRKGTVVTERYALPLDPSLPGGSYVLSIQVTDVASEAVLGVQRQEIALAAQAEPLAEPLAEIENQADFVFGERLWLLGYDQRQEGDLLVLDLYWQALRALHTNWKIFLHLIRPSDGAIVAQIDTMPRGWSYPTSNWDRQEVFVDRVVLNAQGVPPGTYQLALGVYRDEEGRLPAVDAAGVPIADGRVVFDQPVILR